MRSAPVVSRTKNLRLAASAAVTFLLVAVLGGCSPSQPEVDAEASDGIEVGEEQSSQSEEDGMEGVAEPDPTNAVSEAARQAVAAMSVEDKAASVLMIHLPGTDATQFGDWIAQMALGGIILMGDNTQNGSESVANLVSAAKGASAAPLLVGIDQEGGVVSRLSDDPGAGPEALRDMSTTEVYDQQLLRAQYLSSLGINTNFGVVADVTDDPGSFIWQRVLGTTPEAAAQIVAASVEGSQAGDVYATLKHFPGHGAAPGDSHHVIPQTDLAFDLWRSGEAVPFEAGIQAGAELVMMGHLAFTSVSDNPASLAPEWVQVLREDLGFDGVIVTDDMRMLTDSGLAEYADGADNVVNALKAGVDLMLYVYSGETDPVTGTQEIVEAIALAVEDGSLPEERLTDAAERVMDLRLGTP